MNFITLLLSVQLSVIMLCAWRVGRAMIDQDVLAVVIAGAGVTMTVLVFIMTLFVILAR